MQFVQLMAMPTKQAKPFLVGRIGGSIRWSSSLSELGPAPGSTRQQTRVGRGPGSGRGKTSGRGQKGQKARSGVHPWFEGGQTPITQLFPKTGFRSKIPRPAEVNLGTIQQLIDENRIDGTKPITMRELYKSRAISGGASSAHGIKILGGGAAQLKQPLTLSATRATASAIEAIEAAGGSFTAQFYNALNVRALTRPQATLEKYARIPLRARPVLRRTVEFYRSSEARGYLVDAPNPPKVKSAQGAGRKMVNPLAAKLAELERADPTVNAKAGFDASGTF